MLAETSAARACRALALRPVAVFVFVGAEEFFGAVVGVGAGLAVIEVWGWDPVFGA